MRNPLTAAVLGGLVLGGTGQLLPGQQAAGDKERPLPITKSALLGYWEGRSGHTTLRVGFESQRAVVITEDAKDESGFGEGFATAYKICRRRNVVRLVRFGEVRWDPDGELRLTLKTAQGALARGTVITLTRRRPQESK